MLFAWDIWPQGWLDRLCGPVVSDVSAGWISLELDLR